MIFGKIVKKMTTCRSNAGFETLNSFSNAKIIKNFYFRKELESFLMEITSTFLSQN